jgi:aminoglycoside phosphotransferase (APT) family kinase protein
MAWEFSTEPELQEQLDWTDGFVRDEVESLDLVYGGMTSAPELLDYYERQSERPVDEIDDNLILARFKLAVVPEMAQRAADLASPASL